MAEDSNENSQAGVFERITWKMDGPVVEPWKVLRPDPAYHGQWLVAGDLDGNGRAEIVTARNDRQRVTALIATRLDGSTLWTWGRPHAGAPELGYDVPVQIHDLNGDGQADVWLSIEKYLLVLHGPTGRERRRLRLPEGLDVADCITFVDLTGSGRPRDIIVKDRYRHLWAYGDGWNRLWDWQPTKYKTCHHPTPIDIDGDGRDEIMAGYTLLDDDGSELWTMTADTVNLARGHLDCCEVTQRGNRPEDFRLVVTCCGADRLALIDGTGNTIWDVTGHHFESVDAGRVRDDIPGRHIVVDIDHRPYRQGPVWLLDDEGRHLGTFISGYGRHHRLIDWDGDGVEEILIGNAHRLFNGKGECVARFGPAGAFDDETGQKQSGDPGPLAAVGDLDGDQRPEIILHYTKAVRIYRNPRAAKVLNLKPGTGVNFTLY